MTKSKILTTEIFLSRLVFTLKKLKEMAEKAKHLNLENQLNINHFEKLMEMFQEHKNEDGSTGFDIDKFREVFGKILGGNLSRDQMTMLFMKIDANSDGTMDWNEFSTYMMTASGERVEEEIAIEEKKRKICSTPHKDMIIFIDFVIKERKYLTVSRDGTICVWSLSMKLYRHTNTREFLGKDSWVLDAKFMPECSRLILVTDGPQMCFFDLFSIKPRLMSVISHLENNPLCIAITSDYDDDTDMIIYGDDGGFVNVITLNRKVLMENTSENGPSEHLTPAKLMKKDSMERYNMFLTRRKIHQQWVLKVMYYREMNSFVSCSLDDERSLVMGDLERKTLRCISIPKGIETFEFCRRPSYLITGGRDRILRLWNPYVLSKPTASLHGHTANIINIAVNNEEGIIYSLGDDKMIKLWNARSLLCLQTMFDKAAHRPENIISSLFYDPINRILLTGTSKIEVWPMISNAKQMTSKSHESPIVNILFNSNFHQVVSGCQTGTVTLWDPVTGLKIFSFHRPHGGLELTAMCFDKSGRRLITGSRDKVLKMWNFNNGQILRHMYKPTSAETTDVIYFEMGASQYIIAVGWDRKISIYLEDPDAFESEATRVLEGSGTNALPGHSDDISSVTFGEPNYIATSSIDGSIILWNLETGYIKSVFREPNWEIRSKEDRSVEKIIFLNNSEKFPGGACPLVSCHADGYFRIWNAIEGKMLIEHDFQMAVDEGMTAMACNDNGTQIMIGGCYGHVRLLSVESLLADLYKEGSESDPSRSVINFWRAHLTGISSCNFIEHHDMVLTGSVDCAVRLWSIDGSHVGTFGDQSWYFEDPSQRVLPRDLQHEIEMDELMNRHEEKQRKLNSKKNYQQLEKCYSGQCI